MPKISIFIFLLELQIGSESIASVFDGAYLGQGGLEPSGSINI
jgi:hypothetical protein